MLVFPVEPPVAVVQPVVAVQCFIIVVEYLSDDLFQLFNQWVNESLFVGLGGHQSGGDRGVETLHPTQSAVPAFQ